MQAFLGAAISVFLLAMGIMSLAHSWALLWQG